MVYFGQASKTMMAEIKTQNTKIPETNVSKITIIYLIISQG